MTVAHCPHIGASGYSSPEGLRPRDESTSHSLGPEAEPSAHPLTYPEAPRAEGSLMRRLWIRPTWYEIAGVTALAVWAVTLADGADHSALAAALGIASALSLLLRRSAAATSAGRGADLPAGVSDPRGVSRPGRPLPGCTCLGQLLRWSACTAALSTVAGLHGAAVCRADHT